MISGLKTTTLVLEKQKADIPPRLLALREMIRDSEYIDTAVQRIAQVISKKLIENQEDDPLFMD